VRNFFHHDFKIKNFLRGKNSAGKNLQKKFSGKKIAEKK
jgi:hypothetical protein